MTRSLKYIWPLLLAFVLNTNQAIADRAEDAVALQKLTEKLLSQAQKEGGLLLFLEYGFGPSDLPKDYPALGGNVNWKISQEQLLLWGQTLKSKSSKSKFDVGFVEFVEAPGGIAATKVQITESDTNGKQLKRFIIYWIQSTENSWKFLDVEDPPENWMEIN